MLHFKTLRKFLFSGIVALLVISFFGSAFCIVTYTFIWNTDAKFGLSSYSTTISFDDVIYLGNVMFVDGTQISFTNILLDNNNVGSLKFSTQTSNVTVTSLSDTQMVYNVTGSGTQTIYLENKNPQSIIVDGELAVNGIDYTVSSGTTTITSATSSVILNYQIQYIPVSRGLLFFAVIVGGAAAIIIFKHNKKQNISR